MFYGYLSIYIFDKMKYHFESIKTLFYFFIVHKGIDNLRNIRKELVEDVHDFIHESIKNTQYENDKIINWTKKNF